MHYGFGFLAGSAVGAAGTAWVVERTGKKLALFPRRSPLALA